MNTWEEYYRTNKPEKTPWTGVNEGFFDQLWSRFRLPSTGNLLDIGCGRGDKSIYFIEKGFAVWGIDISETAIKEAKKKAKKLQSRATFINADISKLKNISEIQNFKFNVILDLFTSQFLTGTEKLKYLKDLKTLVVPSKTFYLLGIFTKDNDNDRLEGADSWIKEVAQSPSDIKDTYQKVFKILGRRRKIENSSKPGFYIMLAK